MKFDRNGLDTKLAWHKKLANSIINRFFSSTLISNWRYIYNNGKPLFANEQKYDGKDDAF